MPDNNEFCRIYDLVTARKQPSDREPSVHQKAAHSDLSLWYNSVSASDVGAMLVLPTGGGKTFVAIRFLCDAPISDGYKILWLAHTHHLLEQAFYSFEDGVFKIAEPKRNLTVRVVSGTTGHFPVHSIKSSDDAIVGTIQTIQRAIQNNHPQIDDFVKSAKGKLFVVLDEAHHSPAPSYRRLVFSLRESCDNLRVLGLTATPLYEDESKVGWLRKIFPQGIIHQVTPNKLMLANVLAKPCVEEHRTNSSPEFDESEYQKWFGTNRDIPDDIITNLANNRGRNAFIAETYIQNKDKYGKTLIFADRLFLEIKPKEIIRFNNPLILPFKCYCHTGVDFYFSVISNEF